MSLLEIHTFNYDVETVLRFILWTNEKMPKIHIFMFTRLFKIFCRVSKSCALNRFSIILSLTHFRFSSIFGIMNSRLQQNTNFRQKDLNFPPKCLKVLKVVILNDPIKRISWNFSLMNIDFFNNYKLMHFGIFVWSV